MGGGADAQEEVPVVLPDDAGRIAVVPRGTAGEHRLAPGRGVALELEAIHLEVRIFRKIGDVDPGLVGVARVQFHVHQPTVPDGEQAGVVETRHRGDALDLGDFSRVVAI